MKSRGLLIGLIISLGINLGTIGTLTFYYIRKASPRMMWKDWERKNNEIWARVEDSLDISPELAAELREMFKNKAKETMMMNKNLAETRDSLLELIEEPELDTQRLIELLSREEQVQKEIALTLYKNLIEAKKKLSPEKQSQFVGFFKQSVKFTGKPWYIWIDKKNRSQKDHK